MSTSIRATDYQKFLTLLDDADNQLAKGEPDTAHATLVEMRRLMSLDDATLHPLRDEAQIYEKLWSRG
jgi:hypothetical protein